MQRKHLHKEGRGSFSRLHDRRKHLMEAAVIRSELRRLAQVRRGLAEAAKPLLERRIDSGGEQQQRLAESSRGCAEGAWHGPTSTAGAYREALAEDRAQAGVVLVGLGGLERLLELTHGALHKRSNSARRHQQRRC